MLLHVLDTQKCVPPIYSGGPMTAQGDFEVALKESGRSNLSAGLNTFRVEQ